MNWREDLDRRLGDILELINRQSGADLKDHDFTLARAISRWLLANSNLRAGESSLEEVARVWWDNIHYVAPVLALALRKGSPEKGGRRNDNLEISAHG